MSCAGSPSSGRPRKYIHSKICVLSYEFDDDNQRREVQHILANAVVTELMMTRYQLIFTALFVALYLLRYAVGSSDYRALCRPRKKETMYSYQNLPLVYLATVYQVSNTS